jgi:DedD protein
MASKDTPPSPATPASGDVDTPPLLDLKKRARRRLVGAIALSLLAVIVLPMVMDPAPRQASQEIQIRIPSQEPAANTITSRINTAADPAPSLTPAPPPTAPQAPPQATPEKPAAPPLPTTQPATPGPTSAADEKRTPPPAPAAKPAEKPVEKPAAKTPEKPDEKPVEKRTEKSPTPDSERERATALLNDEQWIIQLGAYQNQGNVRVLQAKLKELGYAAFTEKIDTPQGPRIRVRCGPFASRESAEKAQARLKKIGAGGPSGGTVAQAR